MKKTEIRIAEIHYKDVEVLLVIVFKNFCQVGILAFVVRGGDGLEISDYFLGKFFNSLHLGFDLHIDVY